MENANPARTKVIVLTAIAWMAVMLFVLPNSAHAGAVDAGIAAFAAVWHVLGLWFIRLTDGTTDANYHPRFSSSSQRWQ
jgi:hypothetical protein